MNNIQRASQTNIVIQSAIGPDRIAWGFIQLNPKNLQGWSLQRLSRKPVPQPSCPPEQNTFPYNLFHSLLFQHLPAVTHPVTTCDSEKLSSALMIFL